MLPLLPAFQFSIRPHQVGRIGRLLFTLTAEHAGTPCRIYAVASTRAPFAADLVLMDLTRIFMLRSLAKRKAAFPVCTVPRAIFTLPFTAIGTALEDAARTICTLLSLAYCEGDSAPFIGLDGNPIPHLYSAGELGGITAHHYQGGGNIAECIIFGQIAGRNAAVNKGELPEYTLPAKAESLLKYTLGAETDLGKTLDIAVGENEYLGSSNSGIGGTLTVKVKMDGDKIISVEVVSHTETEGIGTPAIKILPDKIVAAQSTEVDTVSGATRTSKAIIEAVNDALSKAK